MSSPVRVDELSAAVAGGSAGTGSYSLRAFLKLSRNTRCLRRRHALSGSVAGTVAYRAEEYVAAESLDVAMRHYAPASLDKVLPFITQLAGAIDFARAV